VPHAQARTARHVRCTSLAAFARDDLEDPTPPELGEPVVFVVGDDPTRNTALGVQPDPDARTRTEPVRSLWPQTGPVGPCDSLDTGWGAQGPPPTEGARRPRLLFSGMVERDCLPASASQSGLRGSSCGLIKVTGLPIEETDAALAVDDLIPFAHRNVVLPHAVRAAHSL
jgi:hypothetical protein